MQQRSPKKQLYKIKQKEIKNHIKQSVGNIYNNILVNSATSFYINIPI